MWSFRVLLQDYSGRDLLACAFIKSGSSRWYSNLPYIEPSETVSGNECSVWICARECVQLHVWGHGSYCVYEILYTSMYQECVCSFNYAAMYNLVCYLNSTSTVHWFSPCVCCCTLIAKGASILSIEYSVPFPPNEWNEKSLLPLLQAAVPFSSSVILSGSLKKKCQILTPWPDFFFLHFFSVVKET